MNTYQQEPQQQNIENRPPHRRRQGNLFKNKFAMIELQYLNIFMCKNLFFAPGTRRRRGRGRGQPMVPKAPTPILKFDSDFDFDSSNAQFMKEELEREVMEKANLKGMFWAKEYDKWVDSCTSKTVTMEDFSTNS